MCPLADTVGRPSGASLTTPASDVPSPPAGNAANCVTVLPDGRLRVSSIYSWFREDFGGSEAGVVAHLRRHAAPSLAARLTERTAIAGDTYDWALNDAPPAG